MIDKTKVDELETLIGQLFSLHGEMTGLTKKSSSDAVNAFKLKLINRILARCNALLGDAYRPFDDFEAFDSDDVPSNSDVTLMIGQYQEAVEYFRSSHITQKHGAWCYLLPEGEAVVGTSAPVRLNKRG